MYELSTCGAVTEPSPQSNSETERFLVLYRHKAVSSLHLASDARPYDDGEGRLDGLSVEIPFRLMIETYLA
jgi:hypothetical protein